MTTTAKEWYQTRGGKVQIVLFFYILGPYLIRKKTDRSRIKKVGSTLLVIPLLVGMFYLFGFVYIQFMARQIESSLARSDISAAYDFAEGFPQLMQIVDDHQIETMQQDAETALANGDIDAAVAITRSLRSTFAVTGVGLSTPYRAKYDYTLFEEIEQYASDSYLNDVIDNLTDAEQTLLLQDQLTTQYFTNATLNDRFLEKMEQHLQQNQ